MRKAADGEMSVELPSGVNPRVHGARKTHAAAGDDGDFFFSLLLLPEPRDFLRCNRREGGGALKVYLLFKSSHAQRVHKGSSLLTRRENVKGCTKTSYVVRLKLRGGGLLQVSPRFSLRCNEEEWPVV